MGSWRAHDRHQPAGLSPASGIILERAARRAYAEVAASDRRWLRAVRGSLEGLTRSRRNSSNRHRRPDGQPTTGPASSWRRRPTATVPLASGRDVGLTADATSCLQSCFRRSTSIPAGWASDSLSADLADVEARFRPVSQPRTRAPRKPRKGGAVRTSPHTRGARRAGLGVGRRCWFTPSSGHVSVRPLRARKQCVARRRGWELSGPAGRHR